MSGEPRFSHRECYFCGAEGYLFREARPAPGGLEASFVIEVKHEGWPGIPHGGVGMTSIVELANLFDESSTQFPWRADFRFGGERIVTSESVRAALSREGDLYRGIVEKNGEGQPYLVGTITRRRESALDGECGSLVRLLKQPVKNKASFRIPVFSDKIIYQKSHQSAHTQRVFEIRDTRDGRSYMVSYHGGLKKFLRCTGMNAMEKDFVHPGALITMLDETLGWAGFLTVWQGGVTVNLSVYFKKPVLLSDAIIVVGLCGGVEGRFRRKMVYCSGGIFARRGRRIVPLVFAQGRWLTNPDFKDKMLRYIIP